MWWVEVTDIKDNRFWSTWSITGRQILNSVHPLHVVLEDESPYLREVYEKTEAEKKAQQFREHSQVAAVRLVQVFQKRPGEVGWEPVWDEDKERLGW